MCGCVSPYCSPPPSAAARPHRRVVRHVGARQQPATGRRRERQLRRSTHGGEEGSDRVADNHISLGMTPVRIGVWFPCDCRSRCHAGDLLLGILRWPPPYARHGPGPAG
jgi:hypothetical protein